MIELAVKNWELNKHKIEGYLKANHPDEYLDLVKLVIENITSEDDDYNFNPDPTRIHTIDDGDYQGVLLFVIAAKGYQPSKYWYVAIYYGSCSGCDTLQDIRYSGTEYDAPANETQLKDYMTLCLHIVQQLKAMDEPE